MALSIADRGSGIAQDEQRRIFERFYRAENARARNVRGSGIGLALVKHIAEAHGGRIEVESAPGRGSTFTVYIPAAPIDDAGARGAGGVVTGLTTSGSFAARRRILIIEDEPDLVRGLRDALEFEGFEVVSSGTGREGVRLLRERGPDLVLLDLMLPDANGFAVCEEIRSTHPLVPVDHADRALAGDRQDPRPRRGRRRLRHQAVLGRRAGRAHQRHVPAPAPPPRDVRRSASRSAAPSSIRTSTS